MISLKPAAAASAAQVTQTRAIHLLFCHLINLPITLFIILSIL